MAGYDGRGTKFPLTIVRGADFAIELTVTSGGSPVDLATATVGGEIYPVGSTTPAVTMTSAISGAGSNVATLSLTDVQTTALTSTRYAWTLWVTRGGDKRPWLAGQLNVTDGTTGQSGTSGSYTLTVDGDLSVTVDVAATGGVSTARSEALSLTPLPGTLKNLNKTNGVAYTQDSVTTVGDVQYAVWINDADDPVVGKRDVNSLTWETFDLSTVAGNPLAAPTADDSHNNYVIGVDADGYIHVSGNHHDDALRYVRSTTAGSIAAWSAPGMVGTEEDSVTYPTFVMGADDELLFIYRNGSAGNGAMYLNAYNTTTQTWARRSRPISGLTADGVTPDESPYWNHIDVTAAGVMHVMYVWRTTADVTSTHDVYHMKSADNGVTFTKMDGTALTLPVKPADNTKVYTGYNQLVNQVGMAVDSNGYPHACWWLFPSSTSDLTHIYWDGAAWQTDVVRVISPGVGTLTVPRPSVFCVGARTFVVYSMDNPYVSTRWWCEEITPGALTLLPRFLLMETNLGSFEPTFDTRAIRDRDELNILITPCSPTSDGADDTTYSEQWGAILSLDLNRIDTMGVRELSPDVLTYAPSVWVSAAELQSSSGSPTLNASTLGAPAWLLDSGSTEVIAGLLVLPADWETFNVYAWYTNASSGSGDIVTNFRYVQRALTENITGSETNVGNVTTTSVAQNIIGSLTLATGIYRRSSSVFRFNLRRLGADAADTLGNDIGVIGIELRRAS